MYLKIRFLLHPGPQVEEEISRNEKESGAVGIKRDEKGAGMSKKERYVDSGKWQGTTKWGYVIWSV